MAKKSTESTIPAALVGKILRVYPYGGTYIAVSISDKKLKTSCAAGPEQAAVTWLQKHTTEVPLSDIRMLWPYELETIPGREEDPRGTYYYTFADERVPLEKSPILEMIGEIPEEMAAALPQVSPTISMVSAHQVSPHPSLARIALVSESVAALAANAHGDQSRLDRAVELEEDWQAWLAEIKENGIKEPIRVIRDPQSTSPVPAFLAIDGRHRLAAAKELGMNSIPTILVDEIEMPAIVEGSVNGRRHWTKSQRAFFAVLMHPEVAAADRKTGRPEKRHTECVVSIDSLATRFGVSSTLLDQAIKLYRMLDEFPDFRDRIEPSLWGGASLAGLLQGLIAMADGTSGPKVPVLRHPPMNVSKSWASEKAHAANWEKLDSDQRTILARVLERETASLPGDYLEWKLAIMHRVAGESIDPAILAGPTE